ncbi:hypothetical protein KAH37_06030 [bacterium]|nr:hypothetical protein [bacterium]
MTKFIARRSIGRLFTTTFALLFFISLAVVYLVFRYVAYPRLLEIRQQSLLRSGAVIVEKIEQETKAAKSLSQIIALTYQFEWGDDAWLKKHIPALFTVSKGNSFIAGGGVWPESYLFTNEEHRSPLFWGHNEKNEFRFFDDYSDDDKVDYHQEEWYLPVRLKPENSFYWSKVYRDPFSHQPMVTCSTPIVDDDKKFNGVATVDVSLSGLRDACQCLVEDSAGYMFAVDSFGTVFADTFVEKNGDDFLSLTELIKKHHFLTPVEALIDTLHHKKSYNGEHSSLIASLLDSPEIDENSAKVIAGRLFASDSNNLPKSSLIKTFHMVQDDFLKEPSTVMVFYMPKTGWSLVIAQTQESHPPLWHIPAKVAFLFMIILLLIFVIGYFILKVRVTHPLKDVSRQLQNVDGDDVMNFFKLKCVLQNEVGELVFHLNKRGITLNRLHETLLRSQKSEAIGTLSGKLSHDFGNILNGVQGIVTLLQMRLSTSPTIFSNELEEHVSSLSILVDQGDLIIKDLMALSRGEENLFSLIPINMSHMVNTVVKPYLLRIDPLVQLRFELTEYCTVLADLTFIETTILNFLINAEHAMTIMQPDKSKRGGEIVVSVFKIRGENIFQPHQTEFYKKIYVALSVKDSGVGMTKEVISRIFDPFFTSKLHGKGTGLGLALVQSGISAHGGDVIVESTVGKGSTFTIYIPFSQ